MSTRSKINGCVAREGVATTAAARLLAVALAAGASLMAGGCVKFRNQTVVMPDGSGNVTLTVSINEQKMRQALDTVGPLLGIGSGGGRKPTIEDMTASAIDVRAIERCSEGLVAFSEPAETRENGWRVISLVAYFDNINSVRVRDKEGGEVALAFAFHPRDDGYNLQVDNAFFKVISKDRAASVIVGQDLPPQVTLLIAPLMKGFSVTEAYRMPGTVTSIQGLNRKAGNIAATSFDEQVLLNGAEARKLAAQTRRSIVCGPSGVSPAEEAAFARELAAAKADWQRRKNSATRR